jgi:cytidylate kinase
MLITLSASYGSGGSQIGPQLAKRIGAQFFDRVIPAAVSERLAVPVSEADAHDDSSGTIIERLLSGFAVSGPVFGVPSVSREALLNNQDYLRETERLIREIAEIGDAVILGRAAAVVLRDDSRALHVRLDAPAPQRVGRLAKTGAKREAVEQRLRDTDRAREAYVKHFYGLDARDPTLYHLMIDSTVIPHATCVEVIAQAARARVSRGPAQGMAGA